MGEAIYSHAKALAFADEPLTTPPSSPPMSPGSPVPSVDPEPIPLPYCLPAPLRPRWGLVCQAANTAVPLAHDLIVAEQYQRLSQLRQRVGNRHLALITDLQDDIDNCITGAYTDSRTRALTRMRWRRAMGAFDANPAGISGRSGTEDYGSDAPPAATRVIRGQYGGELAERRRGVSEYAILSNPRAILDGVKGQTVPTVAGEDRLLLYNSVTNGRLMTALAQVAQEDAISPRDGSQTDRSTASSAPDNALTAAPVLTVCAGAYKVWLWLREPSNPEKTEISGNGSSQPTAARVTPVAVWVDDYLPFIKLSHPADANPNSPDNPGHTPPPSTTTFTPSYSNAISPFSSPSPHARWHAGSLYPLFAHTADPADVLLALHEKAMAKLAGSYRRLRQLTLPMLLTMLCGNVRADDLPVNTRNVAHFGLVAALPRPLASPQSTPAMRMLHEWSKYVYTIDFESHVHRYVFMSPYLDFISLF